MSVRPIQIYVDRGAPLEPDLGNEDEAVPA
jgi:hypothetical protein